MTDTSPYPEIPDHVWRNIGLAHELEAEYENRPRQFQKPRVQSSFARKHFSCRAEADEFWQEYGEAVNDIGARLPAGARVPTVEDQTNAILGLVPCGGSLVVKAGRGRTELHGGGSQ
jgi:hypothetical protein